MQVETVKLRTLYYALLELTLASCSPSCKRQHSDASMSFTVTSSILCIEASVMKPGGFYFPYLLQAWPCSALTFKANLQTLCAFLCFGYAYNWHSDHSNSGLDARYHTSCNAECLLRSDTSFIEQGSLTWTKCLSIFVAVESRVCTCS